MLRPTVVAVLLTGAAAGCSSGGGASTPALPAVLSSGAAATTATITATTPASASASPTPSPTTSTASSPAASGRPATSSMATTGSATPCGDGALSVTSSPGSAGLGHYGLDLLFTNRGRTTCTVAGYPGADGVEGGRQVPAERSLQGYLGGVATGSPPVVTLAPGAVASALLEGTQACSGPGSAAFSALLVTPPGTHVTTRLAFRGADCGGLAVHPEVAGRSGSDPAR